MKYCGFDIFKTQKYFLFYSCRNTPGGQAATGPMSYRGRWRLAAHLVPTVRGEAARGSHHCHPENMLHPRDPPAHAKPNTLIRTPKQIHW